MAEASYSSPMFPAEQVFKAIITEVDSDLNIYFRVQPEHGPLPISRVIEAIEKVWIQTACYSEPFTIGKACIAKSATNGFWQRAVIERIDRSSYPEAFVVRFVDYGTVETVNKTSLSSEVIMPEIPKLALRGYLFKLKSNEYTKAEMYKRFRKCLLDKVVEIRWENFLAQLFPLQITIKIQGKGIFKAVDEEQQTDVSNSPNRVVHSLVAMRVNLNKIQQQFGSMTLNRSVDEMSTQNLRNACDSNNASRAENTVSARQNLSTAVLLAHKEAITHGSSSATAAAAPSSKVIAMMEREYKRLSRLPEDVHDVLNAIARSPFQKLHPEFTSNVFYPVVICEHIAENYCFMQTMPIEESSNENELAITIRHTVFMTLIESMRDDVNNFNLVSDNQPFGLPVCAQFDDEEWYRAVVMSNSTECRKSKVLYIDYGNTREVRYNQLRVLPEKYIKELPTHSFLVKLDNIRPSRNQTWQNKHSETLRAALADITVPLVAIFSQSGFPLEMDIYEASHFNGRVPCRHPLQKLVCSGEFEFVTPPFV